LIPPGRAVRTETVGDGGRAEIYCGDGEYNGEPTIAVFDEYSWGFANESVGVGALVFPE